MTKRSTFFSYRAWIFILEGLLSVIVGFISFFVIQDFPDTARFLTEEERVVVISRLQNDGMFSAGGEVARWKYIWDSIIDWKTWVGSGFQAIQKVHSLLLLT